MKIIKNKSKMFIIVMLFSILITGCANDESENKQIIIESLDIEKEILTLEEVDFSYQVENADNIEVAAEHGEVENKTYIAPKTATTETITIVANNSDNQVQESFEVEIKDRYLEIESLKRDFAFINENLELDVNIDTNDNINKIVFENNNIENNIINIDEEKETEIEVKVKTDTKTKTETFDFYVIEKIDLEVEETILANEESEIEVKNINDRVEDYNLTAEFGEIKNKTYTAPDKIIEDTITLEVNYNNDNTFKIEERINTKKEISMSGQLDFQKNRINEYHDLTESTNQTMNIQSNQTETNEVEEQKQILKLKIQNNTKEEVKNDYNLTLREEREENIYIFETYDIIRDLDREFSNDNRVLEYEEMAQNLFEAAQEVEEYSNIYQNNYLRHQKSVGMHKVDKYNPDLRDKIGHNVNVAIVDSGINTNHYALDHVESKTLIDEYKDDLNDKTAHGTRVAGILTANKNAKYRANGINYNANVVSYKITETDMTSSGNIVRAVANAAREYDADVVNLSFGGVSKSENEKQAYQQLLEDEEVIVVTSAGNERDMTYPAKYDSTIAVGGFSQHYNRQYSREEELDFSAFSDNTVATSIEEDGNYREFIGTSQASPTTAGIISLLIDQKPELRGDIEGVRETLAKYSTTFSVDDYCLGIPNVYRMLNQILIEDAEVFIAEIDEDNNTVKKLSESVEIDENGNYQISEIIENENYEVVAHIDVEENGKIKAGDYLTTINNNTRISAIHEDYEMID